MIWKHRQFTYLLTYFAFLLTFGVVLFRVVQNVKENPPPPKRESFFINLFTQIVKIKRSLLHQNKPLKFSNSTKVEIEKNETKESDLEIDKEKIIEKEKEEKEEKERKEKEMKEEQERLKKKEEQEALRREREEKMRQKQEREKRIQQMKEQKKNKILQNWENKLYNLESKLMNANQNRISDMEKYYEIPYILKSYTGYKSNIDKFNKYREYYSVPKEHNGLWCSVINQTLKSSQFYIALESIYEIREIVFNDYPNHPFMAKSIGIDNERTSIIPGRDVHIPIQAQGNELTLTATGGNETHICIPGFEMIGRHLQ